MPVNTLTRILRSMKMTDIEIARYLNDRDTYLTAKADAIRRHDTATVAILRAERVEKMNKLNKELIKRRKAS